MDGKVIKAGQYEVGSGTALGAKHYQQARIQPIQILQMYLPPEQFIGYLRGCVIKYKLRAGAKGDTMGDAEKAEQYAQWYAQALNGETIDPMAGAAVMSVKRPSCYCRSICSSTCETDLEDPCPRGYNQEVRLQRAEKRQNESEVIRNE